MRSPVRADLGHRCAQRARLKAPLTTLAVVASLLVAPGHAASLEDISTLEQLVNGAGVVTVVADDCPPSHAGFYELDARGQHRLVLCRNGVDLADLEAVWEVMAHEGTHVMQACTGSAALQDTQIPRTLRELRSLAPHYAKLLDEGYHPRDQRLEAEAFWMELQAPDQVIALFERNCAGWLRREAP
ncbi:MAG: hypothetical protein ACKOZW_11570 [Cyanobium sp.]